MLKWFFAIHMKRLYLRPRTLSGVLIPDNENIRKLNAKLKFRTTGLLNIKMN